MDPKHSHGPDRLDYEETSDLTEVHAAIQREHPEPTAEVTPIPLWLTAVCGVAILAAGFYLGTFHGGFRGDVFNAADTTARMFVPDPVKAAGAQAAQAGPSLAEQGKSIYANCQPCHQPNGQGVAGQFPTLVGTDYVASEKRLVALLLKGVQGVINVNGAQFNGAMPAWEKTLNDKKIAAVATYVRASFGNKYPEVTEGKVAAARKEFAAQAQPYTEAQLLEIPVDATLPDAGAAASATPAAGGAPAAAAASASAAAPGSAPGAATPSPAAASPAAVTPGAGPTAGAPVPAASAAPTPEVMALGKAQYLTCMPCHQMTGQGLPPVFPPLAESEYVTGDPKRLAAIILKGVAGPITVNGKPYNNVMPGQGMTMKDNQVAAVATFVRNSFGNTAPAVTPELVAEVRKEHAARVNPWTEAELKAFGAGGAAAPAAEAAPTAPSAATPPASPEPAATPTPAVSAPAAPAPPNAASPATAPQSPAPTPAAPAAESPVSATPPTPASPLATPAPSPGPSPEIPSSPSPAPPAAPALGTPTPAPVPAAPSAAPAP